MQSNYLKSAILQKDILLIEPEKEHKKFIDHIRKEIYYDRESKEDLKDYKRLLLLYSKHHPVIIACTELSIRTSQTQMNILDMASIQIDKTLSLFKK